MKKLVFSVALCMHAMPSWGFTYLDHLNLQHAGEIGFVAAGLGRHITERYTLGAMYGYIPRDFAEGPAIQTVTLRQTYRFFDWRRVTCHAGLNLYHVLGIRYQTSKYGEAPSSYYPVGSIRGLLNLGTTIVTDQARTLRFYAEAGLNDIWLTNWASNQDSVNPSDHVSMAIGWIKTI